MEPRPFLDTNVLIRAIANDHVEQSPSSRAFLESIESGNSTVVTSSSVILETVYTLQSVYKFEREAIVQGLQEIPTLDHLHSANKARYIDIFRLFLTHSKLSFADCCHAVLAREPGDGTIVSFDRGFDRIPGLTRIEPAAPA